MHLVGMASIMGKLAGTEGIGHPMAEPVER